MIKLQKALIQIFSQHQGQMVKLNYPLFVSEIQKNFGSLKPEEMASLFIETAFISSAFQFLAEEYWIQNKDSVLSDTEFKEFISPLFNSELWPLYYLEEILSASTLAEIKVFHEKSTIIEKEILIFITSKSALDQKSFISSALALMTPLFNFENNLQHEKKSQGLHLGLSLYRAFDGLDEVFNLNYLADHDMKTDLKNTERLYEGAGVGVQSSYSTLLTAIANLNLAQGCRFIDLGSGYGRVGLVLGLMRPDIDFIGYEFVDHRVSIANSSSEKLGLSDHVHFYTQDLSHKNFQIPEADIYYLYDPFSKETYEHVLSQLVEIGKKRPITIATKGNARGWLLEIGEKENWPAPKEFDSGNLCLFQT
jgi:hypothetical protein